MVTAYHQLWHESIWSLTFLHYGVIVCCFVRNAFFLLLASCGKYLWLAFGVERLPPYYYVMPLPDLTADALEFEGFAWMGARWICNADKILDLVRILSAGLLLWSIQSPIAVCYLWYSLSVFKGTGMRYSVGY